MNEMKNRLFLFIGIVGVSCLIFCGAVFAGEQGLTGMDPDAEATMEAAAEPVPQWSSSLDGIRTSTATLLETNNKLTVEHKMLSREVDALTGDLLKQQQVNKGYEDTIRHKNEATNFSATAEELQAALVQKEREIAEAKSSLAVLKAKQQNLDRRMALRRLKLKDLELQKKAAQLEHKSDGSTAAASLEDDIPKLKEKVKEQEREEQSLREQIEGVTKKDDPVTAQQRQLYEENRSLKVGLEKLENERKGLEALLRGELPPGTGSEVQANFQKYQLWEADQRKIKDDIARLSTRKDQLANHFLTAGDTDRDLEEKIKVLQEKNRILEVEVENLRENIAVLDYKIHTLERYRDRNKAN
jgi:chromosome segregation ATPase